MHAWRANIVAVALIAIAALTVNRLRPPLNTAFLGSKTANDVYTLPPTTQLTAMSLGYRSALADPSLRTCWSRPAFTFRRSAPSNS